MRIVLQNCLVENSFGKQMYLKIGLSLKELRGTRDTLYISRLKTLKTYEQIAAAVYLHVLLFTLLYLQCMKNIKLERRI